MRIGIASTGETLESEVSPRFGRSPYFLIVEQDALDCACISNPAAAMPGGAGPAAVQTLADQKVEVVIAGEFGPKAQQALDTAGIRGVKAAGPVREALKLV